MFSSREEPTPVSGLSGKNIVGISCGSSHSAAISAEGDLYTWGRGNYGQLGHGKWLPHICCIYFTTKDAFSRQTLQNKVLAKKR